MPEVWHADPSPGEFGGEHGAEPHPAGAGWWEELASVESEEGHGSWCLVRHVLEASVRIPARLLEEESSPGPAECLFACLEGAVELVVVGKQEPLRKGEVARFSGVEAVELRSMPRAQVLELTCGGAANRVSVEILELGARELREPLGEEGAKDAVLFVSRGEIEARVSDEDDPFCLQVGASLWIRELDGGEELWLRGSGSDAAFALLRI